MGINLTLNKTLILYSSPFLYVLLPAHDVRSVKVFYSAKYPLGIEQKTLKWKMEIFILYALQLYNFLDCKIHFEIAIIKNPFSQNILGCVLCASTITS